jgi:hypothetical protein
MRLGATFKEHSLSFFIGTVLLGGWLYAIVGTYTYGRDVADLEEDLAATKKELTGVKQSVVSIVVADPKKAAIVSGLVADATFFKGISNFASANYTAAFSAWEQSAAKGTEESIFAINAAKATLQQRIADPATSADQRQRMEAALIAAPEMQIFGIRPKQSDKSIEPTKSD